MCIHQALWLTAVICNSVCPRCRNQTKSKPWIRRELLLKVERVSTVSFSTLISHSELGMLSLERCYEWLCQVSCFFCPTNGGIYSTVFSFHFSNFLLINYRPTILAALRYFTSSHFYFESTSRDSASYIPVCNY